MRKRLISLYRLISGLALLSAGLFFGGIWLSNQLSAPPRGVDDMIRREISASIAGSWLGPSLLIVIGVLILYGVYASGRGARRAARAEARAARLREMWGREDRRREAGPWAAEAAAQLSQAVVYDHAWFCYRSFEGNLWALEALRAARPSLTGEIDAALALYSAEIPPAIAKNPWIMLDVDAVDIGVSISGALALERALRALFKP